jgi:hypothetical protein
LHWSGRAGHFIEVKIFTVERYRVTGPEFLNNLKTLDQTTAPLPFIDTE